MSSAKLTRLPGAELERADARPKHWFGEGRIVSLIRDRSRDRSYLPICDEDLRRLGRLARIDRQSLFERKVELGRCYGDRLFAVALCQGAALHRINGTTGVKDFDVWSFYINNSKRSFPYRRRTIVDFDDPKFGRTRGYEHFVGRKVDLLGRSLFIRRGDNVVTSLREYLRAGRTLSARHLAEKAVILIEPEPLFGYVVWPEDAEPGAAADRPRGFATLGRFFASKRCA